jgi:hypothetical protein
MDSSTISDHHLHAGGQADAEHQPQQARIDAQRPQQLEIGR